MYWGVTIVSKKLSACAYRIVSETGIYKAVVVSARAKECLKWKDCTD